MARDTFWESIKVKGDQVVATVRRLVHEGNVRRIAVKQGGRTLVEFPMTVGVVGTLIAPVLAAVGALAALLSECTIEVERVEGAARRGGKKERAPRKPASSPKPS